MNTPTGFRCNVCKKTATFDPVPQGRECEEHGWYEARKGVHRCPECWERACGIWNAEIDVAVAEIEARVGPHPATPEYQVWLKHEAERAGGKA